VVNGEPITTLDIAQRIKLTEVATHKVPSRQEALDDLIDEKLKLQIAKHYAVDIGEKDLNSTLAGMAQRAGYTTEQFSKMLAQSGISVAAFKEDVVRFRSDLETMRTRLAGLVRSGTTRDDLVKILENDYGWRATGCPLTPPTAGCLQFQQSEAMYAELKR